MKRLALVLASLGFLTACGADGDPFRTTGGVGINVDSNGNVTPSARVGATNGTFSVGVGL